MVAARYNPNLFILACAGIVQLPCHLCRHKRVKIARDEQNWQTELSYLRQ